MRGRSSLTREEARLWAALAETVKPLNPGATLRAPNPNPSPEGEGDLRSKPASKPKPKPFPFRGEVGVGAVPTKAAPPPRPLDVHGLDAGWERKLAKAVLSPDFTLDLHGHTVAAAHARLDSGLAQAAAMGARLVLVITGRPRPVEAADRGTARGAIRAKVLDWLALGPHASRIAAVRPAQRRHGGAGALYVVLKRPR